MSRFPAYHAPPDPTAAGAGSPCRHVVLVAYPGCQLLDVSGPWQVFASANDLSAQPLYRLNLLADARGALPTNGGLSVVADLDDAGLAELGPPDTLLVVGGSGVFAETRRAASLDRLRRLAPSVRRLGAICSGAFLLAEAGLLDGRRATTHWRHCDTLRSHYPFIDVDPDALYVEDDGRYTSAGVTAGIDLALSLVEADHGSSLAARVARELVMFLHRPGGQSQFSGPLAHQAQAGGRLRPLIDELLANPGAAHDLASMAERLAVTPRHLSRLFRQQLGQSPGEYLTRLRLDAARQELAAGQVSLARLASRWQLGGPEQLRRLFHRHYGVSPSIYHARFGPAAAPQRATNGSPSPAHDRNPA
ncbi:GlxA family transcriptional regulator [Halomonas sp. V046]|uniref:GlxA family transcriptional regulator n=1 Tax=Halomonas sp. V046 TaxID=3459611 RepID=UPI00404496B6